MMEWLATALSAAGRELTGSRRSQAIRQEPRPDRMFYIVEEPY